MNPIVTMGSSFFDIKKGTNYIPAKKKYHGESPNG